MSYAIEQSERYLGNDYWDWSAWVEASKAELDRVSRVVWVLHPTFPEPRRTVESRDDKFRLDASGWGVFRLRAEIHLEGEKEPRVVSKMLVLTYPEEAGYESAKPRESAPSPVVPSVRPTLYLSYASEDADRARALRSTIESLGAKVVDGSVIPAGTSIQAATRKLIRESDGVVFFFGSAYASPWVLDELRVAARDEKPVVAVAGKKSVPELLSSFSVIDLDDEVGAKALSSFVGSVTKGS